MYHYIYMIKFNTGQFYIGSRKSKVDLKEDINYWGSPVTYKYLWEDNNLEKTKHIIKICNSFEQMRDLEIKLIKFAWKKYPDNCLNRNSAPTFHPEVCRKGGKTTGNKNAEINSKEYCLKNVNGDIFYGKNISKFCRENNLDRRNIVCVIKGKMKSYKGWHLPETDFNNKKIIRIKKEFTLISSSGETYSGNNVNEFCKQYNLHPSSIRRLVNNKVNSHKGWTLVK